MISSVGCHSSVISARSASFLCSGFLEVLRVPMCRKIGTRPASNMSWDVSIGFSNFGNKSIDRKLELKAWKTIPPKEDQINNNHNDAIPLVTLRGEIFATGSLKKQLLADSVNQTWKTLRYFDKLSGHQRHLALYQRPDANV